MGGESGPVGADIERIRRELQHAVINIVTTAQSVESAGQSLLPSIAAALRWDCTSLWIVDGEVIRCVETWSIPDRRFEAFVAATLGRAFQPGQGLPGRVWQGHEPLWIDSLITDANFPRGSIARDAGLASGFAFPITNRSGTVGVIECFSAVHQEADADVLALAELLGAQIGQFLERLAVERRIEQNERRYAAIVNGALDAIIAIDAQGRITEFNRAAEQLFGHAREAVLGTEMAELIIPAAMRAAHREGLRRQRESGESRILGQRLELRACRRDGSEFPVELTITKFDGPADGAFVGVLRDITDRQRHAEERDALLVRERLALEEASAASRLKDEFLAALSHELRTPLNAVLGWAQMLESGTVSPDRLPRAVAAIRRNAEAQQQIVNDMLDLSAFITGRAQLPLAPLSARTPIEAACESIKPAADAKRITLKVSVPEVVLVGNALKLQQVFWNLLGNAVKFTPTGGTITLSGETDGDAVTFRVRDSGSGIDPAFLPFVFDRFRQASNTRVQGGLGLGLALAKQIVEAHGGTVSAHSEGIGAGAEIVVNLPLA